MNILKVRFRTNREFEEHYQEDLPEGGLFCPTTKAFQNDEYVIIELSLPALPNKLMIKGKVKSWRAAQPRMRVRAGAIIEFSKSERLKRDYILSNLAGTGSGGVKRKYPRLPIDIPVTYRIKDETQTYDSSLSEISAGGAMLRTESPLPLASVLVIDLLPPGAAKPVSITGKVTYHLATGDSGLKFVYRDSGGAKRLKEWVRRIREAL